MPRTILVPLDGSAFGEHALSMASAIARKTGGTLHLLHVGGPDGRGREYLASLHRRLNEAGPVAAECELLEGDVPTALKAHARTVGADLVVMSTHGQGEPYRLALGKVADELTEGLLAPVLLIRGSDEPADLAHPREPRSILVPLDGTELAEKAIEPALALGLPFDAEFTLVRVNAPASLVTYLPEGAGASAVIKLLEEAAAIDRRDAEEASRYLEVVADRMRSRGARVRTHVVLANRPVSGILAEAETGMADLIVIETHGRHGLARFFMGSVADSLVRRGGIPVMVHHGG